MAVKPGPQDELKNDGRPDISQTKYGGQKRWVKRYRTEVAASMSSILSTFVAVSTLPSPLLLYHTSVVLTLPSFLWTQSRPVCKPTSMIPSRTAFDTHTRRRDTGDFSEASRHLWRVSLLSVRYHSPYIRDRNTPTQNGSSGTSVSTPSYMSTHPAHIQIFPR